MQDSYIWTPPGLSPEDSKSFLESRSGIPAGARSQVIMWLTRDKYDHEFADLAEYLSFQTAYHQDLDLPPGKSSKIGSVRTWLQELDDDTLVALIDFRLSRLGPRPSVDPKPRNEVARLKDILQAAASNWTVGDRRDRWGLRESMPEAVFTIAREVTSTPGNASPLLNSAWESAFGVDKRPSHAYYDAVRAVEVLSCPLISPLDKKATLGKDISIIHNNPSIWKFALSGDRSVDKFLETLRLLWHSQTDRHGREDYQDVTVEEAQAAVLLATTIVGWLSRGLLKRITQEE